MSTRDESASSSLSPSTVTSMASPHHHPHAKTSQSSVFREATIPESPDDEEAARETTTSISTSRRQEEDKERRSISPSKLPPPPPPSVPKRDRAMSSAHLTQFLGSKAAAARRSLAIKPLMESTPNAPQFLTVSPAFNPRDRSRSPSPSSAFTATKRSTARHSIDVRNFPSYLQRKRTSLTFGAGKMLESLVEGKSLIC